MAQGDAQQSPLPGNILDRQRFAQATEPPRPRPGSTTASSISEA